MSLTEEFDVPDGIILNTGIAWSIFGGEDGYLKYGLTINNWLAADILLADAPLIMASAEI